MNEKRLSAYFKKQEYKISLTLGEFILTSSPLGQGGNGLVYEAKFLDKIVAIKFLVTDEQGNTRKRKLDRFLAEYFNIIIMEDLSNIVRYIDFDILKFTDDTGDLEIPTIIMKRYDGALKKHSEAKNIQEFHLLFKFLIKTTKRIHQAGIIHRDIKPENILLDGNNFILADFGIANYNPEIFQIRAKTEKHDRLANRLFSAPEQENSDAKPHSTMDIYAIGQVLQWYATGKIHRGTGRQFISTIFSECEIYDRIVDKCLQSNPINRFQSIQDIEDYIEKSKERNIWEYLELFNLICRSTFPKNDTGIIHSNEITRIDRLFNSFLTRQKEFDNHLWWHTGFGNMPFTLTQKGNGNWKFSQTEYNIKEIWVHYDGSIYNDFILVHYIPSEPFIINGEEIFDTYILDDKYHISYCEYENGYAEIEGLIKDLSEHTVERIERKREEGYFFIGTRFHCVLRTRNDKDIINFIARIKTDTNFNIGYFDEFAWKIRKHKHPKVEEGI